jgi:O6-methylguanine-DNA--protein-cysteine methyltransferase
VRSKCDCAGDPRSRGIRADGGIPGYRWRAARKRQLLQMKAAA